MTFFLNKLLWKQLKQKSSRDTRKFNNTCNQETFAHVRVCDMIKRCTCLLILHHLIKLL